jgi:mannosylglycoprotein endo-beta-mannosidase
LGKQNKIAKANLLAQIHELDRVDDSSGLDEEEWAFHYQLEDQLMQILSSEEEYWWQRGRQNWILFGDVNTVYFHAIANGRRCKSAIHSLQSDHGLISNPQEIMQHIYWSDGHRRTQVHVP